MLHLVRTERPPELARQGELARTHELVMSPAAAPWCGPWLLAGAGVVVAIAILLGL